MWSLAFSCINSSQSLDHTKINAQIQACLHMWSLVVISIIDIQIIFIVTSQHIIKLVCKFSKHHPRSLWILLLSYFLQNKFTRYLIHVFWMWNQPIPQWVLFAISEKNGTANGTMVQTATGTMVQTFIGTMVQTSTGSMVQTSIQTMVQTSVRAMVQTSTGTMV